MENLGIFITIWTIFGPLEIVYGHLVYFVVIWYIFPVLVFWTKKNLATLHVKSGDETCPIILYYHKILFFLPGTDVMIFNIFSTKNSAKKIGVFDSKQS
jgi:hypothetical protein